MFNTSCLFAETLLLEDLFSMPHDQGSGSFLSFIGFVKSKLLCSDEWVEYCEKASEYCSTRTLALHPISNPSSSYEIK